MNRLQGIGRYISIADVLEADAMRVCGSPTTERTRAA
jgi:hypothetical protein